MKDKICISIDRETLLKIKEKVGEGLFRNKSHVVEYALQELMRKGEK